MRINIVDPETLPDQHLMAEIRYHKMVPNMKDWIEHFDEYITFEKEKYANTCT